MSIQSLSEYILNNSNQGILAIDENKKCCLVNSSAASVFGLNTSDLLNNQIDRIGLPVEYFDAINDAITRVFQSGNAIERVLSYKANNDFELHRVLIKPFMPSGAGVKGAIIYFDEIIKAPILYSKIGEAEDKSVLDYLESIIQILPAAAFIADRTGKLVATNELASRIYYGNAPYPESIDNFEYVGYKPGTSESYKTTDWGLSRAILHGETSVDEEVDILKADGSMGTFLISAAPIKNDKGEIIGGIEIDNDITSQKKLEKELATTKASLEAIINQMPVCVSIVEATTGNIIMSNQAYNEMVTDPVLGKTVFQNNENEKLYHLDMTPMAWEENPLTKAITSGRSSVGYEAFLQDKDGKIKPILTCAAPVRDEKGNIRAGVSIIIDISEIKKQERRMHERIQELTNLNSELRKFAYVSSQDLRESMRMISTYLQFIEQSS